jgi:hypothetical protein
MTDRDIHPYRFDHDRSVKRQPRRGAAEHHRQPGGADRRTRLEHILLSDAPIDSKAYFAGVDKAIRVNTGLKLFSRPGENDAGDLLGSFLDGQGPGRRRARHG